MSKYISISDMVLSDCKGVTPKYVEKSTTIVLNQKCVHDFTLDYSQAQYISDEQKISQNKYLKKNDILINSTGQGTAGRCTIVTYIPEGYKVTVDSHMLIIRCRKEEDAYLLAYHLYQNENFIMGMLSGSSGQGELDKVRLFKLKVPMPEQKEEKNKIHSIIAELSEAARNNDDLQNNIDNIIHMMYQYYFVQYDFDDDKGKAYSQNGGEMQWSEELKKEIPINWETTKLGEIADIITEGVTPNAEESLVYEHYSIPAYDNGKYPSFDSSSSIDSNKYKVVDHSILVSKLNPQFKRLWDPINFGNTCICSTEFMPFVAKDASLHGFLYALLNSEEFQKYMVQCSSSSTGSRKRMSPELCEKYVFAIPKDKSILVDFSRMIDELLALAKLKRIESKRLLEVRTYLFPELITETAVL